jgi:hypothetical protein
MSVQVTQRLQTLTAQQAMRRGIPIGARDAKKMGQVRISEMLTSPAPLVLVMLFRLDFTGSSVGWA